MKMYELHIQYNDENAKKLDKIIENLDIDYKIIKSNSLFGFGYQIQIYPKEKSFIQKIRGMFK